MQEATKQPAKQHSAPSGGSPIYGLGMIGAAVYYFSRAGTRQEYALALPKALIWPATLVYTMLQDHEPSAD